MAFAEIIAKLKLITTIVIESKTYQLNWNQGGDYKWDLIFHGLNAANSNCACLWCHWNKKDPFDINAVWSIYGRSHEESALILSAGLSAKHNLGYKHPPLIDFIAFDKCVYDPLHA